MTRLHISVDHIIEISPKIIENSFSKFKGIREAGSRHFEERITFPRIQSAIKYFQLI